MDSSSLLSRIVIFSCSFHSLSIFFWFETWPRLWILCIILQQKSLASLVCTSALLSLHIKECITRNMFRIIASTPFIVILYYILHQRSFRKLNRESSSNHCPVSLIHSFPTLIFLCDLEGDGITSFQRNIIVKRLNRVSL